MLTQRNEEEECYQLSQLQDACNKVCKKPNPIPTKLHKRINDHSQHELQPYMDSFLRIHNQVTQLCHDQVLYNNNKINKQLVV